MSTFLIARVQLVVSPNNISTTTLPQSN